jgi:hypothetical protein
MSGVQEEVEVEVEWNQYQIEQERQDQYDLKLFYEMKNEEANVKKAK